MGPTPCRKKLGWTSAVCDWRWVHQNHLQQDWICLSIQYLKWCWKKRLCGIFFDGYHQRLRCMGDRTVRTRHTKNMRHNNSGKTGSQKDVLGTELGIFDMLNEHEWMLNFSLFPIFLVGSTLLIEISCQRGHIPWTCGRNVCWINVRFLISSHHVYPA